MVVGPKELLEKITEDEAEILENLEKRIDQELLKNFDGTRNVIYAMDGDPRKLRRNVLEGLLSRYRQAGWKVKIVYDQRDGDFINFDYAPASNTEEEK